MGLPTSRRSLTKSTTQPGIALWAGTSGLTSRTRPGISSTSTSGRWPFCCSRVDKIHTKPFPPQPVLFCQYGSVRTCSSRFNLGHSWLYHQPKIPVFILNLISKHLTILVILVVHLYQPSPALVTRTISLNCVSRHTAGPGLSWSAIYVVIIFIPVLNKYTTSQ